jgi:hypothetical protein
MISNQTGQAIVTFLVDAGALNQGSPAQGVAWADIINDPMFGVPELRNFEAKDAARLALKIWADEGRSWKVDAPHYVQAVRALWRERRKAYKALAAGLPGHDLAGDPVPEIALSGDEWATWLTAANTAIRDGAKPEEVRARAYMAVGRDVPVIEATEKREVPALTLKGI